MSGYSLSQDNAPSKVLYINSRNANTVLERNNFGEEMRSNFLYVLTEKLVVKQDQMALLSLYSATIPHSFFNVRDGVNDKICLQIHYRDSLFDGAFIDNRVIQLDDGNYDTKELIRQIIHGNGIISGDKYPDGTQIAPFQNGNYEGFNQLKMEQGAEQGELYTTLASLNINYDQVNNCFRFQLDATDKVKNSNPPAGKLAQNIQIFFNWASSPARASAPIFGGGSNKRISEGFSPLDATDEMANSLFGFSGLADYPFKDNQVSPPGDASTVSLFYVDRDRHRCVLQSQRVIDLNDNIHGLMLRTNLVSKGTLSSNTSVFSNILARIPINSIEQGVGAESGAGQQGGMIYFNPSQATHQNLVDLSAIDVIGVRLTDDRDRTIDLNGLDFQIAILLQYISKGGSPPPIKGNKSIPPLPTKPNVIKNKVKDKTNENKKS